jgi:hypothetical protein
VAGVPAGTVTLGGATLILKSATVALALAVAVNVDPRTVTVPLFPMEPATVGVRFTVTVAVAPAFKVPIEHVTVDGLPVGEPQLPGEVAAETKVAPEGSTSEKVTPVVKSPLLVMVYLKLTWLPTPVDEGVAVAAILRVTVEPSLLTKVSLDPLRPD